MAFRLRRHRFQAAQVLQRRHRYAVECRGVCRQRLPDFTAQRFDFKPVESPDHRPGDETKQHEASGGTQETRPPGASFGEERNEQEEPGQWYQQQSGEFRRQRQPDGCSRRQQSPAHRLLQVTAQQVERQREGSRRWQVGGGQSAVRQQIRIQTHQRQRQHPRPRPEQLARPEKGHQSQQQQKDQRANARALDEPHAVTGTLPDSGLRRRPDILRIAPCRFHHETRARRPCYQQPLQQVCRRRMVVDQPVIARAQH
ncbi:MAG: hypothetical protein BWY76_02890 [bacterium ADurb.Bin429]|nr:MAG: hypothetical protein BWY76_02890 [bacterium ADurb.Bin429]